MSKLDADLELAHALIEDREKIDKYFWQFYHIWPFTTINMKEYLAPFDLKDKTCATIQGSSDHVFEIFLKQPKKIIGIDTNPLTGYYCYLKIAAFNVLENPKEFLDFFRWYDYPDCYEKNRNAFDKDIYQEISKYLKGDTYSFWEDLFKTYEPLQIRTNLFKARDEGNNEEINGALTYITPENYEYIRNNLDKLDFTFLNEDIRTLAPKLEEKIDFLTMSNLIIYAHDMYPDDPIRGYKTLINELATKLNKRGQIVVGYLYDIEDEENCRDIYKASLRDPVFKGKRYSYNYVTRMTDLHRDRGSNNHDAILIYTNK